MLRVAVGKRRVLVSVSLLKHIARCRCVGGVSFASAVATNWEGRAGGGPP